jgi:hypothetical protein
MGKDRKRSESAPLCLALCFLRLQSAYRADRTGGGRWRTSVLSNGQELVLPPPGGREKTAEEIGRLRNYISENGSLAESQKQMQYSTERACHGIDEHRDLRRNHCSLRIRNTHRPCNRDAAQSFVSVRTKEHSISTGRANPGENRSSAYLVVVIHGRLSMWPVSRCDQIRDC